MDTSPLSEFITRKQAADQCRRSERTLQRYWSKAIAHQDQKVLADLKLRTEDGEIIDGPAVTKERIDELRQGGKNPTWYAEGDWVIETYGSRTGGRDVVEAADDEPPSAPPQQGSVGRADESTVTNLREQIEELKRDKERLHTELGIKNEQIKEANARTRESNTLMQELQKMLGSWQDQAFKSLPARAVSPLSQPHDAGDMAADVQPAVAQDAPMTDEKGTAANRSVGTRQRKSSAVTKRKASAPKAQPASSSKPKWYEMPTVKRILSRSS